MLGGGRNCRLSAEPQGIGPETRSCVSGGVESSNTGGPIAPGPAAVNAQGRLRRSVGGPDRLRGPGLVDELGVAYVAELAGIRPTWSSLVMRRRPA